MELPPELIHHIQSYLLLNNFKRSILVAKDFSLAKYANLVNWNGSLLPQYIINVIPNERVFDKHLLQNLHIKHLYILYDTISDVGIEGLDLTSLCLFKGANISDQGIRNMKHIKTLWLGTSSITEQGISHLKLQTLLLGQNSNVSEKYINSLHTLENLGLTKNSNIGTLSNKNIKKLELKAILPKLETLQLKSLHCVLCKVDDGYLQKLPNLEKLVIVMNIGNVSDDGISGLIKLRILNVSGNVITDEGISKLTNLRHLTLRKNEKVTNQGLFRLNHLETVHVDPKSPITGEELGLKVFKKGNKSVPGN